MTAPRCPARLHRRTLAGVVATGLSLPVLAACGGDDGSDVATDPDTPSSTPGTPSTSGSPGTPSSSPSETTRPTESSSEPVDGFARTSDIEVGGGSIYRDEQIVITQPSAGKFKCFTAVCTHQGCLVSDISDGNINCECHGSAFSIVDGSVITGPATEPLAEEAITVQGDAIILG